ncbi:MAG: hypothetical protein EOP84_11830, partial [Verrucomicrobiaceae bacterium]
ARKNGGTHYLPLLPDDLSDMKARMGRARDADLATVWFRQKPDGKLQAITPRGHQAASQAALDTFERMNDPVGSFLKEQCCLGTGKTVPKAELLGSFKEWCEDVGLDPDKCGNFFFKTIKQRFPDLTSTRKTVGNDRAYYMRGIELKEGAPTSPACGMSPMVAEIFKKARQKREAKEQPEDPQT